MTIKIKGEESREMEIKTPCYLEDEVFVYYVTDTRVIRLTKHTTGNSFSYIEPVETMSEMMKKDLLRAKESTEKRFVNAFDHHLNLYQMSALEAKPEPA